MIFRSQCLWVFFFFGFTMAYFRIFDNFIQKDQKKNQEIFHNDWLREMFQNVYCSDQEYLCSDTLQCVNRPENCPCPFPTSQRRCLLGNGNYVCVSLSEEHDPCQVVEQYRLGRVF
ncbi:hypothetical protein PCANB_002037 [Pneumocystis canis]|nr:hypothetical protein PCK1_001915 [Pneumocystis canis]KAG5439463.1 hypothetical protein PCANB_002037 [Pneumocystis canis]